MSKPSPAVTTLRYVSQQPSDVTPAWAAQVPRWSQLDPASAAVATAWHHWLATGALARDFRPGSFVLASPAGSHASDVAFVRGGAFSPARFVSTLPSVTLAALWQTTGWVGPMYCVQDGERTLASALREAELLWEVERLPACVVSCTLMAESGSSQDGGDLWRVDVRLDIVGLGDHPPVQLPAPVSDLGSALPHRPPMVWVDWVLTAEKDGGTCAVDLSKAALYAGEDGNVLRFAPVEWLAEAYGYVRACYERRAGTGRHGASRALLVGISELEIKRPIPLDAGRLLLDVRLTREMLPMALVDGVVKTSSGEVLATARLKLYFEY